MSLSTAFKAICNASNKILPNAIPMLRADTPAPSPSPVANPAS